MRMGIVKFRVSMISLFSFHAFIHNKDITNAPEVADPRVFLMNMMVW